MKKIDNYPELKLYMELIYDLSDKLFNDKSAVTEELLDKVLVAAEKVDVDAILKKCYDDVLIDRADSTTVNWFDKIHQAEQAVRLCKMLETTRLIKVAEKNKNRWNTPKLEKVN